MNSQNIQSVAKILELTWPVIADALIIEQDPVLEECQTKLFTTALSVRFDEAHCSGARETTLTWNNDGSISVESKDS